MADCVRQWQTATDNDRMIQTVTHGGRLRHTATTCALQTVIYRQRQTIADHNRQWQLQEKIFRTGSSLCLSTHLSNEKLSNETLSNETNHASTAGSCIYRQIMYLRGIYLEASVSSAGSKGVCRVRWFLRRLGTFLAAVTMVIPLRFAPMSVEYAV